MNDKLARPANSSLDAYLHRELGAQIQRAMKGQKQGDRMSRVVLTALRTVRDLANCTQASFAASVLQLSLLDLEPNTPLQHAYLIPRRNKHANNALEATLLVGYRGYVELGHRAGVALKAHAVREGDVFEYELGLDERLVHKPSTEPGRGSRRITHAYAVARGARLSTPLWNVIDSADIAMRRARAQTDTIWKANEQAMSEKSAVRAMVRWVPQSSEDVSLGRLAEVHEMENQIEARRANLALGDGVREGLKQLGLPEEPFEGEDAAYEEPFESPRTNGARSLAAELDREPGSDG